MAQDAQAPAGGADLSRPDPRAAGGAGTRDKLLAARDLATGRGGVAGESDLPDVVQGSSPLLAAANQLLNLIPQLRAATQQLDPDALREYLVAQMQLFEQRARNAGVRAETIIGARYCLCTVLDETAAQTPWGGSGAWSRHSLLVTFHNETWGGEKFFQLLSKLAQNPQQHLELLELMNVCLALGFEGRYRVVDNGRSQLETLRQRLAQIIRTARGELDPPLSPHWRGELGDARRRLTLLPPWVAALIAILLGLGAYYLFQRSISATSDALFSDINGLRAPKVATPVRAATPVPVDPRLRRFLEPEIRERLVDVRDDPASSTVTLFGDGLFDSSSSTIREQYRPVIGRVATALNEVRGAVVVRGYTDNVPIRTARFPSNYHLSKERAESVKAMLDERLAVRGRVTAEGLADANPVAPNDSPANRARNRRVEILLVLPPPERDQQLNAPR
jgi:type VI secretion system protein ImpK